MNPSSSSQAPIFALAEIDPRTIIDFSRSSFWFCIASIAFAPLFWNIVVRTEYKTKWMSRLFGGNYRACYTLAAIIFLLSLERDWAYVSRTSERGVPHEAVLCSISRYFVVFLLLA